MSKAHMVTPFPYMDPIHPNEWGSSWTGDVMKNSRRSVSEPLPDLGMFEVVFRLIYRHLWCPLSIWPPSI